MISLGDHNAFIASFKNIISNIPDAAASCRLQKEFSTFGVYVSIKTQIAYAAFPNAAVSH